MSKHLPLWQVFILDLAGLGLEIRVDDKARTLHLECRKCHTCWRVPMNYTNYECELFFAERHCRQCDQ